MLHALVDQGTLRRLPKPIPPQAPPVRTATGALLAKMTGFWAGTGAVLRITAAASNPQSLVLSVQTPDGWTQLAEGLRPRTDGAFHGDGSATSFITIAAGGRRYLVTTSVAGYGHYRYLQRRRRSVVGGG